MSDRAWFYADGGKQLGPYSESQFRNFIADGTVSEATYVWTSGMENWQRAQDVPGLLNRARPPGPPSLNESSRAEAAPGSAATGARASSYAVADGPVSVEFGVFGLFGWALLMMLGTLLVIPAPWIATRFYQWIFERMHVPGRPNLSFTGKVGDIWWVFILLGLSAYVNVVEDTWLPLLLVILQAFLSWMIFRWLVANIASNGQPLGLSFNGSVWTYIGWQILFILSFITIIGWAWVMTAWMRWVASNIAGTRRAVVFTGSGLEVLWRTLVFSIGCMFIIPIPWVLAWYTRWYVSQFVLVQPGAVAANG
jgi:hypothetical protein